MHRAADTLHLMAATKRAAPTEVNAEQGKAGRLGPPPDGAIYVRDPQAARAKAVKERVAAFKAAGEDVPEELTKELAAYGVADDDLDVNLVDAVTGELLAEVDVGDERPDEPQPEPEPEADVELEAPVTIAVTEPEPEPEPKPQAEEPKKAAPRRR